MVTTDFEAFMARDNMGGLLMRALSPLENTRAVRNAHAMIKRQARLHSAEDGEGLEVGTVTTTDSSIDLNGVMFDIFPRMKRALKSYKGERINLRIHSGGGSAFEGSAMYNLLKDDGRPVTTRAMGMAASAASLVFMAGDERIVAPGAMLMIHDVWSCGMGNAADMRQMAEELDAASDAIAELYAATAGGKVGEWRAVMASDTYLTGDQAVEMGLATGRETPVAKARKKGKAKDEPAKDEPATDVKAKGGKGRNLAVPGHGILRTI